jgi:hypothetical protein
MADDATAGERLRGRNIGVAIANDVNTDPKLLENRVIKGTDVKAALASRHEDIGGTIVRP